MEVSALGRPGSYVGWSIYSCILGSVLAVLGWRYWAGGRPGGVGTVAGGRVEAVAAGSDCWAGCRGLYELGEASGACAEGACADGGYADGGCAHGACTDGACIDGACIDGACTDGACTDRACIDGACINGACTDGACCGA